MKTTRVCFVSHCSFTTSGQSKAKSAVEAARQRHMQLMKEQQEEDDVMMGMSEWTLPDNISRPESSTEQAAHVCNMT